MQLPFTHDQFLDVFAAYNSALWPGAVVLWLATIVVVIRWVMVPAARAGEMAALLAAHWAWSALGYHAAFFTAINPTARFFVAIFLVEAALFVWFGLYGRHRAFGRAHGWRRTVALVLIIYALLYPGLGVLFGLEYPRMPTFGVPCPTTILTIGFLMVANRRDARVLGVVPLVWAVVGGSAAFLLGVRADLMLAMAGLVLIVALFAP